MNKPINIKEFFDLVKRYETITLQEIKDNWSLKNIYIPAATRLTGFGSGNTCTLCRTTQTPKGWTECHNCVYQNLSGCCRNHPNALSYNRIRSANTPLKLFNAYKARAKHLRLTYPQYLK